MASAKKIPWPTRATASVSATQVGTYQCDSQEEEHNSVQYAVQKEVKLPNGNVKAVLAGTVNIDGYWACLRREVGRLPVNTGTSSEEARRDWLHKHVRVHQ